MFTRKFMYINSAFKSKCQALLFESDQLKFTLDLAHACKM